MSDDYDIKVTGEPQTYGDGATRNSKEGKGRYDLIPVEPFESVLEELTHVMDFIATGDYEGNPITEFDIMRQAVAGNYVKAIAYLVAFGLEDADDVVSSWYEAFKGLAIHFEKGAKIYGERNCEKGIPLWSFRDSGIRHLIQHLQGMRDENHYIAAIWNFWMAEWTIIKGSECNDGALSDKETFDSQADAVKSEDNLSRQHGGFCL